MEQDYTKVEPQIEKEFQKIEAEIKDDKKDPDVELITRHIELEEVYQAFEKIGAVSREVIDIAMAIAYSSLKSDLVDVPLWGVLVGPPSSMKTELVKALRGLEHIYYLDTLTSNPFSSGYVAPKGRKSYDLLDELDNKCLVIRDMTTLFSLNEETVKKLLGELVAIYDEEFAKFSPTRGLKSYKAKFSLLGCITPAALNKHRRYIDMIGARFLFIRLPELTSEREKKGFGIAWQSEKRKGLIKYARELMYSYITQIDGKNIILLPEDGNIQEILNGLAVLVSRGRGTVLTKQQSFKDDEGKDRTYYEVEDVQVEEPWRALLQLRGLSRYLAIVRGKETVTTDEMKTLAEIGLSTMPVDRAEAVQQLFKQLNTRPSLTSRELQTLLPHRSHRTFQRLFKELEALKMVDAYKDPNGPINQPWHWFLREDIQNALTKAYGIENMPQVEEEVKELPPPNLFDATQTPNDRTVENTF
ncbi:MAG: hypothetical protein HY505_02395 [Candidatus Yanofskybacteria bacterium]|nr:hypothetical protein [Candidatus Yanofskybacteria bacterium]